MDWAGAAIWAAYVITVAVIGRLMGAPEGRG